MSSYGHKYAKIPTGSSPLIIDMSFCLLYMPAIYQYIFDCSSPRATYTPLPAAGAAPARPSRDEQIPHQRSHPSVKESSDSKKDAVAGVPLGGSVACISSAERPGCQAESGSRFRGFWECECWLKWIHGCMGPGVRRQLADACL